MRIFYGILCNMLMLKGIKSNSDKIIKNINFPACKNCKFYKPNYSSFDFTSSLSKCEKFGEKDIFTDKINFDYVSKSRNNENKCGEIGKFYEPDENIELKISGNNLYALEINIPNNFTIVSDSSKGNIINEIFLNKYFSLSMPVILGMLAISPANKANTITITSSVLEPQVGFVAS